MYITGWTVLLTVAGAIPGALLQSSGFVWLWLLGVAVIACVDALLAPATSNVGIRRSAPASVRLTEATESEISLANLSARSIRGAVRDAWQPSAGATGNRHRFSLRGLETVRFTTALKPTRRGDRRAAAVTIRTEGPLRLAGRQRSVDVPAVLRVLPEFASRRHLPARLARLREIDGQTAVNLKGAGSEFDSLREYVIGDDVRTVDWRASARRADVVVKTFRPERDRRVFIVLDSSRLSAGRVGSAPRLDASIEATLLLAALASKAGDRTQITAFDRKERARAMGSTGGSLMPKLADALAVVEPSLVETDWPAVVRLVQDRMSQRALVVLLTTIDNSSIDSGLLDAVAALSRNHQVLVASVEDPEVDGMLNAREETHDLYGAGAAARSLLERDAVATRLRQLSAEVVSALPDDLAPAVSDRYLALKASGRL